MSKNEVATAVAEKLFAAERTVDAAMIAQTELLQQMIQARAEVGVAATTGELAQVRVCEAIAALSEARRATMAAHAALANLQKKMDIEHYAAGPGDKPDQEPKKPTVDLRAVS